MNMIPIVKQVMDMDKNIKFDVLEVREAKKVVDSVVITE
jgi:hypothetical protein